MTRLGTEGLFYWRRFAVDLLTAGAAFAVVLAAMQGGSDALSVLLLSAALIGLSLWVEPHDTVNTARDMRLSGLSRPSDRATAL